MAALVAALTFLVVLGQSTGRIETLVLPNALRPGETAWLEVKVGVIARGAEIEIATTSGRLIGVISPFAVRAGNEAGTYTLPLPPEAISKDRVSLRLSLRYSGSSRAPTLQEVQSVRVRIAGASDKPR